MTTALLHVFVYKFKVECYCQCVTAIAEDKDKSGCLIRNQKSNCLNWLYLYRKKKSIEYWIPDIVKGRTCKNASTSDSCLRNTGKCRRFIQFSSVKGQYCGRRRVRRNVLHLTSGVGVASNFIYTDHQTLSKIILSLHLLSFFLLVSFRTSRKKNPLFLDSYMK